MKEGKTGRGRPGWARPGQARPGQAAHLCLETLPIKISAAVQKCTAVDGSN